MRSKLAAAADYLAVAPAVVGVVRDLELPTLEEAGAELRPVAGDPASNWSVSRPTGTSAVRSGGCLRRWTGADEGKEHFVEGSDGRARRLTDRD